MLFRLCWLLLAVFLASCSGSSDSEEPDGGTFSPPALDSFSYGPNDAIEHQFVNEAPASKAQTITLNGNLIQFTATAGHLVASNVSGPLQTWAQGSYGWAAIFYTAYTRNDLPKGTRPVTFVFNGGPGGAADALDVDFLGPKNFNQYAPSSATLPLLDNPNTLLDKTDLVFIDPVGTGYSTAIAPSQNREFWGVDSDAKVVGNFIARYINANNRQKSPKYIYGVSYGGIRAPIVGRLLIESSTSKYAVDKDPTNVLTGLVLNSPVLDLKTNCYASYVACDGALPTYAMVGDVHKRSSVRGGRPAETFLTDVRTFADDYKKLYNSTFSGVDQKIPDRTKWEAFLKGSEASPFLNELFNLTGVGKLYQPGDSAAINPWIADPNMDAVDFTQKFDPSKGKLILTDGRKFIASLDTDPSFDRESTYSEFAKLYQQQFIGYNQSARYVSANGEPIDYWNYMPDSTLVEYGDRTASSIPDLDFSVASKPGLKVLIQHGYYDLNTPFHQSELNIATAARLAKIPIKSYEGGHGVAPFATESYDKVIQELRAFYDQPAASTLTASRTTIAKEVQ